MSDAASRLQLSMFPVEFSGSEIELPRLTFLNEDDASAFLRQLPRATEAHREAAPGAEQVDVFIISGEFDGDAVREPVRLYETSFLPLSLLARGIERYFKSRGFFVRRDRVGFRVLEPQAVFERGHVSVRRGLFLRAGRPFAEAPGSYAVTASWITPAEFSVSLEDDTLRSMSSGHGVLFRPGRDGDLDPELRRFRNRFLGTVKELTSDSEAAVYCADHSLRLMQTRHLFLEAKPSVLVEYDRRLGLSGQSVWTEILKLNHTLTPEGRRNTSVLRDRLISIRKFLGNGNRRALTIQASPFDDVEIDIGLVPITVPLEHSV